MNVCQKCGDKGVLKDLIYCVQCKVSAEHRYCLDTLPKRKKEKVVWTCEECTPKDNKIGPVPSRKSERISQAAEVRVSRKEMRKQISFSRYKTPVYVDSSPETKQSRHKTDVHVESLPETKLSRHKTQVHVNSLPETKLSRHDSQVPVDSLPETKQSGGDCLFSCEEFNGVPFSDEILGNQELRKKKRRLLLEDGDASDEESNQIKAEASHSVLTVVCDGPLNTSCNFLPFESGNCVHSQPTIDPIWRGRFNINNVKGQTSVGLVAHLTSNACSKVVRAATVLPPLVNVEILAKSDVWPQRFQISPPTDDSVVLHFFPEYESDEKAFDSILDDMIDHNLALKAVIKDRVLLVFSSRELPLDHWRVCRKYYWWGVFEPINNIVQIGGSKCATTSKIMLQACS